MKQQGHLVGVFLLVVFGTGVMVYQRYVLWDRAERISDHEEMRMPMLRDGGWKESDAVESERWYWDGDEDLAWLRSRDGRGI